MGEKFEYVPTPAERDELGTLWVRSGGLFSMTQARTAWVAKTFVVAHPDRSLRDTYAWLEKNK